MKKIYILSILGFIMASCSQEKENGIVANSTSNAKEIASAKINRERGEIPGNFLVYTAIVNASSYRFQDLDKMYKKDVARAEPDFRDNLVNMWLTGMAPKLLSESTAEQKLFYLNEQVSLENNLAHFRTFYSLLTMAKISKEEKQAMSANFYNKNMISIAKIQWDNPNERKDKELELVAAKQNFTLNSSLDNGR